MKFRPYQQAIIEQGSDILTRYCMLYLAMEVRTGKTLTSFGICEKVGATSVLFVTKKKAIIEIETDQELFNPSFDLTIINYESLHKLDETLHFDTIICDEAHSMGAFPKASKRARQVRTLLHRYGSGLILMSGTPTPESFSQMYHQMYGHRASPFAHYKNFYAWAHDYVDVRQKMINGYRINDYSRGVESKILEAIERYTISYTQKEAGFKSSIEEEVRHVRMDDVTYTLCRRLQADNVIEGSEEAVLADTGAKMMSKLHQLYSGTVIFESGNSKVLDWSKAQYIEHNFSGKKLAIFYKFKAELKALQDVFTKDTLTTDLATFRDTPGMNIALQIVSGREGISLKEADHIVYFNIDFSATSYWQSRDRMTTQLRPEIKVYWIFAEGGIEDRIYKVVNKKKNYTLKHFKEDLTKLF